jgi:hypothetical protein
MRDAVVAVVRGWGDVQQRETGICVSVVDISAMPCVSACVSRGIGSAIDRGNGSLELELSYYSLCHRTRKERQERENSEFASPSGSRFAFDRTGEQISLCNREESRDSTGKREGKGPEGLYS